MRDIKFQEFSNFLMAGQFCSRYNNNNDNMVHNLNMLSYYSRIMTLSIYRIIDTNISSAKDIKEIKEQVVGMVSYISKKYIKKCIIGDLSHVIKNDIRENDQMENLDVLIEDFKKKMDNPYLDIVLSNYKIKPIDEIKNIFTQARDDVRNSMFLESNKVEKNLQILKRLENTYRWNNTPLHTKFSILEHQFITAIITYAYMLNSKTRHPALDIALTTVGSLFHDILEIFTDDVIRPIKKLIPDVLQRVEANAINELYTNHFTNIKSTYHVTNVPNSLFVDFIGKEFNIIKSRRDHITKFKYHGDIVRMCDNVSAYSELTFDKRSSRFVNQIQRIIDGDKKVNGVTGDRCELLYTFSRDYKKNYIEKIMEWLNDK